MRGSRCTVGLALTAAVAIVGCGGSDDASDEPASTSTSVSTESSPASTAPDDNTTTSTPATTAAPATSAPSPETTAPATTAPATTAPATTVAVTIPSEPTLPPGDGSATAVVEIGEQRFEFRVIQCLFDQPSVFGDQMIEFTLDGVPIDTPDELVEPLLGVMDPDTDMLPLLEPVLEYGPALTVSRFEGGGDYSVVYDLAEIEYLSDPDPLSSDVRFLSISDGDAAVVIAGATTSDGRPMAIAATCP